MKAKHLHFVLKEILVEKHGKRNLTVLQVWLVTDITGKTQASDDSTKQEQHQIFAAKISFKTHQKNGELVWTPLTEALEEISYLQRCMQMLSQESQKW